MNNDEDSSEAVLDENDDSFDDEALKTVINNSTEPKNPTYVERNMTTAFLNSEINETFSMAENTSRTMVSEYNENTQSMLEAQKEKAESISKLESSYYELQAKLEIAEVQRVRDQAEIDRLNSQVQISTRFEKITLKYTPKIEKLIDKSTPGGRIQN